LVLCVNPNELPAHSHRDPDATARTHTQHQRHPFVTMRADDIVLYDMDMGPFASMCRLQLAEKGIAYKARPVSGATMENLEPFYAHLNPNMTVPTVSLKKEGKGEATLLTDSRDILEHFEDSDEGVSLIPGGKKRDVWRFIDEMYAIKIDSLYINNFRENSPSMFDLMRNGMLKKKLDTLELYAQKYPELKEQYEQKRAKQLEVRATVYDSTQLCEENKVKLAAFMDNAESLLAKSKEGMGEEAGYKDYWLFGAEYSLADAVLTCFLSSLGMFNLVDLEGKPEVASFLARAKKRPSYKAARIVESIPMKMKMMLMPLLLVHKIKSLFSKGAEEADKAFATVKKSANEKLDEVVGAKK